MIKAERLEEVLRAQFSKVLGVYPEFKIACPYCDDKRERLYINVIKGLGYCFNCGESVGPGKLKKMLELKDSKNYSANDFESLDAELQAPQVESVRQNIIHLEAVPFVTDPLPDEIRPIKKLALDYLEHRGFSEEVAVEYQFLLPRPHIRERGRLILPVFESNRMIYYQARALVGQAPKYLNPTRIQCPIGKSNFVFGLDEAANFCLRENLPIILCEGIFSAISVGRNAVAIFGKELSTVQAWKILRAGIRSAIILFDPGTKTESLEAARMLCSRMEVRIGELKTGDPNEVSKAELLQVLKNAVLFEPIEDFLR